MAGEDGRGCNSHQTVAVILFLCSLAQSSTCFSLQGLSEKAKQDELISEATVMEVRMGSILFNGKNLHAESGSASATATGNGLLNIDPDQQDGKGMSAQMSLQEDNLSNEAAWQQLNPSLHCGQKTMKFTAMGPGAADLQLDMGNAAPRPLDQVPDACDYSMTQNALGLVLVVPYDGCNVIQEDGDYILPMTWLDTPVQFSCPVSTSSATSPPTTPKSQEPKRVPYPFRPWNLNRRKRQATQPLPMNDPRSPYYSYWYYYYYYPYYMNMMTTPAPTPTTTTTTKAPETTVTTKPSTEKPPPVKHPAYPKYPYYPYYPYYPLPQNPVTPATPATTGMTTTMATTTPKALYIKGHSKPAHPAYQPYFSKYPYYLGPGKPMAEIPGNSKIYHYPKLYSISILKPALPV